MLRVLLVLLTDVFHQVFLRPELCVESKPEGLGVRGERGSKPRGVPKSTKRPCHAKPAVETSAAKTVIRAAGHH